MQMQKKQPSNLDTVVQDNSIIEATHKLNRNEMLAFKKIISMVDTKYRERELKIPKRDIVNFLFPRLKNKEDIHTGYFDKTKQCCMKLIETSLKIYEFGKYGSISALSICSKVKWPYNDNHVSIEFSDRIMPLIFELKKCFTQYPVGIIQQLKSKHSIRIYEYCRMNLHNQKEEYTWSVPLEDFKRILNIESKGAYHRFNNFNERILLKCIPEINEKTNLNISFETVREFKRVVELILTVKEKSPKTEKEIANNKKLWNEQPSRVATGESRQISY